MSWGGQAENLALASFWKIYGLTYYTMKIKKSVEGCGVVAHESRVPRFTIEWLLPKKNIFSNFPAFQDLNGILITIWYILFGVSEIYISNKFFFKTGLKFRNMPSKELMHVQTCRKTLSRILYTLTFVP